MKQNNILLLFMLLTGGASMSAQQAGKAGITLPANAETVQQAYSRPDNSSPLRTYLQQAVQSNPTVQKTLNDYAAALKRIPQAEGLPDPELNLGILPVAMELPAGKQVADIQLMQQLPLFGVLKAATEEQRRMAGVSYEAVRQVCLELRYTVETQYWNLYRNRQQARIIGLKLENLRQRIRFKTGRIQSGSSLAENSMTDLYSLQAEEAELLNTQTSLEDAYQNQASALNYLLNRPPGEPVSLPDSIVATGLTETPLSDTLLNQSPMLRMTQLEQEALESRRRMNERMGYPMIGVGLRYTILAKNSMSTSSMNGKDMLMPMVSVSLPVFRKKYRSRVEETEALQKAAEFNQTSVWNRLKTDLNQAGLERRDAWRSLELNAKRKQLTQQTKQERLRQYALSQIDIAEVLMVSEQLLDIDWELLNATVDYRIAEAHIRQLLAIDSGL